MGKYFFTRQLKNLFQNKTSSRTVGKIQSTILLVFCPSYFALRQRLHTTSMRLLTKPWKRAKIPPNVCRFYFLHDPDFARAGLSFKSPELFLCDVNRLLWEIVKGDGRRYD